MYKGKKTLFYNGEILLVGEEILHGWYDLNGEHWSYEEYPLIYNREERESWEVIIVLPGVEVIPQDTFRDCWNVETVIMTDSVTRINDGAFYCCDSLRVVRLSNNLEYIGESAFSGCGCGDSYPDFSNSGESLLTSIFIPESCREIGRRAFYGCKNLLILSVPRHTQLGESVIAYTALMEASHFEIDISDDYLGQHTPEISNDINEWIQNSFNEAESFALYRECASIEPSEDNIYGIIKQQGLPSVRVKNQIGLTAFEYLQKNPYTDLEIDEQKLINRLVLDLMGEIIS